MWDLAENGWHAIHPSDEAINVAKLERFAKDTHHPNLFEQEEGNDRWVGDLAEAAFAHWLRAWGVPFAHNGGVDQRPDFIVAGMGVGMKCRTVTTTMHTHYVVNVPDEHMRREVGERTFFFAAYEERPNRLLLLGCMSRERFRAEATRVAAGSEMHAGLGKVANACWNIAAGELAPPASFLDYVKSRVAA